MNGLYAGVDLGGTTIKVAIAAADGDILAQDQVSTNSHLGPSSVLNSMGDVIGRLKSQIAATSPLIGIGMGVPGLVDIATGTTRFLPNLPTQWRNIPVGTILQQRLGCPVRLLNDVRAATLGELRFGHGKREPQLTMAFFSIGTGVGGGVALKGDLWLGPLGSAGELGHQTIVPDGLRCGCGNRGCLETLASGTAIAAQGVRLMRSGLAPALHALVDGDADRVTTREMTAVADQDPLVHEALVDAANAIGIAAANVVTILHPDLIVLGGGVAEMGTLLTDTVQDVITCRVGMFPTNQLRVERSLLGEQAGLYGAVALAMNSAHT